ncbi:DUF2334 domain-containing protein [Bacillus sp. 179-C3.3 HS]|uniref:DUF2334 domain-containing protein n=1 Tax=Bacillus sp. 179-C3.3 HS TaxID=3232162 RepID=UPI0039A17BEF
MNYNPFIKSCLLIVLLSVLSLKTIEPVDAITSKPDTLIIYSTETGEITPAVRMLDLLVGHVSKNTEVVSEEEITLKKIKEVQQVIYIGEAKKRLSKQTVHAMNESKHLIAIGYNAKQLDPFSKFTFHQQGHISQIKGKHETTYRQLNQNITAWTVQGADKQNKFLLKKNEEDLPFVVQTKHAAYIGTLDVLKHHKLLAEIIASLMPNADEGVTKYLRLDDISPVTDEKKLLELGQFLTARHIPYLLSVTPTWIDSTTGEEVTLSDRPKLVHVLKQLQESGGSIILHGFSRTYRTEESGQGFEFWDAKFDQPITTSEPNVATMKRLRASHFPNQKAYDTYTQSLQQKEAVYTADKLTKGIELLSQQGLYPLAFKVPHDAMSQHSYHVISQFVTSLFGQVQLTDETWNMRGESPYITTPAMLHGMSLYPEQPIDSASNQNDSLYQTEQIIQSMQHLSSFTMGVSYQAEAGLEGLQALITQMEVIPSSEWLELKKTRQSVQTEHVQIKTTGDGHIQVKQSNLPQAQTVKRSGMENLLLILTVVVLLFIVAFAFYTLYLRLTMKKRIFKERKSVG